MIGRPPRVRPPVADDTAPPDPRRPARASRVADAQPSRPLARTLAVAGALLACLALGACQARPRHPAPPPAVPEEILAIADTAGAWVGAPRPAPDSTSLRLLVLWDLADPACLEMMPAVEAWHEAYARFGLRVVAIHFADAARLADSAAVGAAARRLGLRFAIAVSAAPPPAALAAGRGPVLALRERGSAPRILAGASDARDFERRLRAVLRDRHPEARFPDDRGDGPSAAPGALDASPSASVAAPRWRVVPLAAGRISRGPLSRAAPDRSQPFTTQFRFQEEAARDVPVPVGGWTPRRDGLEAARGGAANFIAIRYDAGRVGLVMAPPSGGAARVWVLQDERWIPAGEAGEDVRRDAHGSTFVLVDEPRLYSIARGGRHVLKLSPDVPGVWFHAYQFEAATPRP